ncbi:ribosome assembly RNA-binding protein YhbY [Sulfurirhabdus autotrophica]|uniref:Putative YhbY family RNA-binding protein n=1 Tax=Sulfurirhabdus autotrophica TaxID=1706046 RepID=A0A4R3YIK5_9PROT|nr:ribosome assembly RNA-binding protein YhbY [Sulfurirhabdus autotrophica]TCV90834.1 putative YhbY family RNA-binding protein [Sulfurirhabdus autotrophica]
MLTLTPAQRRFLRAQAHALSPVVMIGDSGLTESVLKETDNSLKSHELIKIKVAGDDRTLRETILSEICTKLNAVTVQHIGKTLIIYRPAAKPKLKLP